MANEWDPTLPIDHTLISDLPGESRKITSKVTTVLEKEHRELGDGNSGGEHTQGSGITFFLPTASAPTTDPAGTAFVTADLGRLWFDTTTSELKVLVEIGPVVWKIIPSTAAAILLLSTLDVAGNFSVATNKFNVAAATGNVDIAGTLTPVGITTLADGSLATTQSADDNSTKVSTTEYTDAAAIAGFVPTSYAGEQSITFPNGLILKHGTETVAANTAVEIDYADFSTAVISASVSMERGTATQDTPAPAILAATDKVTIVNDYHVESDLYWQVWGY
jgi:hypothetical protein